MKDLTSEILADMVRAIREAQEIAFGLPPDSPPDFPEWRGLMHEKCPGLTPENGGEIWLSCDASVALTSPFEPPRPRPPWVRVRPDLDLVGFDAVVVDAGRVAETLEISGRVG
jgi:hypothetical protein